MRLSTIIFNASLALVAVAAPPVPPGAGPDPKPPAPPAPSPPPPGPVFATTTPNLPPSPIQSPPPPPPFPPLPEEKGRANKPIGRALWDTLLHYGEFTTTAIRGICWPAPKGTTWVKYIDRSQSDIQAGIFRDPHKREIIVSFPGTRGKRDEDRNKDIGWRLDVFHLGADWKAAGIKCGDSCRVHAGFLDGWTSVQDEVIDTIKQELKNNKWTKVVVTGHSQGGAIGTLAYASLRALGFDARAYVTAPPQSGNDEAVTYIEKLSDAPDHTRLGRYLRVTAGNDEVPSTGALDFIGFTHPRTEIWLAPKLELQQKPENTYRCFGRESEACNAGAEEHDRKTHSEYAFVNDDYYCENGKLVNWL